MATAVAAKQGIKELVFEWEGKDKNGKVVRGEMRAGGEAMVSASLRRQGADRCDGSVIVMPGGYRAGAS